MHQRSVGGEAAEHFAGLCGLKKLGALVQHMRIDRVAQVGRDALAQPTHHVEARGAEQAQRKSHAKQGKEVLAQRHHLGTLVGLREAAINQAAQRHREQQGGGCGQHQEQQGHGNAAPIRAQKGNKPGKGPGIALGGVRCNVGHARSVGRLS